MEVDPYGQFPLPDSSLTIAELIKQAGYATGLFGKWGLGVENTSGDPQRQGFDEFYGYYCQVHAHNSWPGYLYHNGVKEYLRNEVVYMPEDHWSRGLGGYATKKVDYSNDLIMDAAEEFIRQHKDQPFFLYLPVTIPHNNGEAPAGAMLEIPEPYMYADSTWPEEDRIYATMITSLDGYVGRISDLLDKLQLSDRSVIFFTSDNGGFRESALHHNGILRGMKRDLYEGGLRVPLIARWPGVIVPGTASGHISGFQDFLPTVCEIAGISYPEAIDGISYLPALKGKDQPVHEYLYWEFHEEGNKQAVRMGRWKAVRLNVYDNPYAPLELYDLENDPSESMNVAGDLPELVKTMERIMEDARTEDPNWPLFR
jgi:arylsulfatase A-like enzyme